jgi:hypothetical protein
MKKSFVSMMLGVAAMVALSGCDPTGLGTLGTREKNSVKTLDLANGYGLSGPNGRGGSVTIEFCNGGYDYYRNGVFVESGYVRLVDGTAYLSKVDFHPSSGSYAIETDDAAFHKGDFYEIAGVRDNFDPLDSIYTIPCP